MQPTSDFDANGLARSLLRRSRQGALATLMAGSGDPYCSLVNVASHPDGSPILLISRLALHTTNILGDSRVSLMLDERAEGDPLEGLRIMLAGRAEEASPDDLGILRRRYLNAHPSAETFVNFKDFAFFRIRPSGAHLVAGFGRIVDVKPEQFLTGLVLHRLRSERNRHTGRHDYATAGFSAAHCHACRIAADAKGICRSSPRCGKHLSCFNHCLGINQIVRDRLGKPGVHQY